MKRIDEGISIELSDPTGTKWVPSCTRVYVPLVSSNPSRLFFSLRQEFRGLVSPTGPRTDRDGKVRDTKVEDVDGRKVTEVTVEDDGLV